MLNHDLPTLDKLTNGVFTAGTSSQRSLRVKAWLASDPSQDLMQAVYKELSARDKGASKPLRERLDELKRGESHEKLGAEWAEKAQTLLGSAKMNMADGMAWERDAQKAGAPLSKEPLLTLRNQLKDRVQRIESLQYQIGGKRETAAMFTQRLDVLSTQPLGAVLGQHSKMQEELADWLGSTAELTGLKEWADIDPKLPHQLSDAATKLQTMWAAFNDVLTTAIAAKDDANAPLPAMPVWADEIRVLRGQAALAEKPAAKPKIDPEKRAAADAAIAPVLAKLETELAEGHGKASAGAANQLRAILKEHGAWVSPKLDGQCQSAFAAAGELEGWQRWRANQIRDTLVDQALALVATPLSGRKQQEAIRSLRDQWKEADKGGTAPQGLWKKFDDACNEAYTSVAAWLEKVKAQSAAVIEKRKALIAELKAWGESLATDTPDWRAQIRALHGFSDKWREAGHLGERDFDTLNAEWKTTMKGASAALDTAQTESKARRSALIDEAKALSEQMIASGLRIDAIKALQGRWSAEAQAVPLDRKLEDKLWAAFKAPIDAAFARKDEARKAAKEAQIASLSAHDQAVIAASKALDEANASGDAQKIQAAVTALQLAMRGQTVSAVAQAPAPAPAAAAAAAAAPEPVPSSPNEPAASEINTDGPSGLETVSEDAQPEPIPVVKAPPKPVVAVRKADDRVAAKPVATDKFGKKPFDKKGSDQKFGDQRFGDRKFGDKRFGDRADREALELRAPRLSDDAYHAQRRAMEAAEGALKKLKVQAQGEVVSGFLAAWESRSADALPDFGKAVNAATRTAWTKTLAQATSANASDVSTALLRLEMASGVPTPADQLDARRAYQLTLLTKRNDPAPAQTCGVDMNTVLASPHNEAVAKRVQAALKVLLKA